MARKWPFRQFFSYLLKRKDLYLDFYITAHPLGILMNETFRKEGVGWSRTYLPGGRELCVTLHTGKHSLYCVKQLEFRTRKESYILNSNITKQNKTIQRKGKNTKNP